MLRLLLGTEDGGTGWRQRLRPGASLSGFEAVGPLGLLRRIGRVLGLREEPSPEPERSSAFEQRARALDDGARFYSRSRARDPFGVPRRLLRLRDELRSLGWTGAPLDGSARLRDLAALEALPGPVLPPGLPDLAAAGRDAVRSAGSLPVPLRVELAAPREAFPPVLLSLLDALASAGAEVILPPGPAPCAPDGTDLGRLQRALLGGPPARLDGDGSVLLLEADTPLEAAELAAAVVRHLPLARTTAVAPAERTLLDAALRRQGLATLGDEASSRWRPALQVLPLRLALAFAPRDPQVAADLLLQPVAPLPRRVRNRLLGSLNEEPGVGGPAWTAAVAALLAEARERDGEEASRLLGAELERWLGGPPWPASPGMPCREAAAVARDVADWARSRAHAPGDVPEQEARLLLHAAEVAAALSDRLLALPEGRTVGRRELEQLHAECAADGFPLESFPGESGRPAACRSPGAVLPGCDAVLWWAFVEEALSSPSAESWSEAERRSLSAAGVELPPAGRLREEEARAWRGAVLAPARVLVLVRWRLSGREPAFAHPLVDELRTRTATGSWEACTVTSAAALAGAGRPVAGAAWRAETVPLPPHAPVAPRVAWRMPGAALRHEGALSATGLESLLGCPLQWALRYRAGLRPGRGVDLPSGARLLGSLAHAILQDLVLGPAAVDVASATPEEASRWAVRAFDERVATRAAALALPGSELELARARDLVASAAAALLRHLRAGGWRPVASELELEGTFDGVPAAGKLDLLLEKGARRGVLDLKLGHARHRREALAEGCAVQLAFYAGLAAPAPGGPLPPTGYLVLEDGQLLALDRELSPQASAVPGPTMEETLEAARETWRYAREALAAGLVVARHASLPGGAEAQADAVGRPPPPAQERYAPPCRFCHFTTLCTATTSPGGAP